jgi:hypothetical protein
MGPNACTKANPDVIKQRSFTSSLVSFFSVSFFLDIGGSFYIGYWRYVWQGERNQPGMNQA